MKSIFLSVSLFFLSLLSIGQTSLQQINLENGPYSVGFKHYLKFDSTRTYLHFLEWRNTYSYRPISISVWYPSNATNTAASPMKVLDYMSILKEEEEWEHLPNELILDWFSYLRNTPENQKHLKEESTAYQNILPAKGNFPVVIYAPSLQASSIENFAICELLASHGYIVISSPSKGSEFRYMQGGTLKDIEAQARDLEFLIKEASSMTNAAPDLMATMGFSFGGISHILTQMRNEKFKAIVSLDGSIRYQYDKLKASSFFDINKVDVPFIHMAQKNIPQQVLDEDGVDAELNTKFEFYDSLKYSRAYQLKFNHLSHSYFSTLGVLLSPRDSKQDKSDQEIMASYRWAAKYALQFLNAFLKGDKSALQFIENKPETNNVPNGLISYTSKKAQTKKFTIKNFHELAIQNNYENLISLYESQRKIHPDLNLVEWQLNKLGLYLQYQPTKIHHSIQIFLLAIHIYPNSSNLYDSLAEAYLLKGEYQKAKENFKKSLALNAENQNAINRLKELNKK